MQGAAVSSKKDELIQLLENVLIPDLEDYMDDLFEVIASKKTKDPEAEAELAETREVYQDFQEILQDAANGEMDEAECAEVLEELREMMEENPEEE